MFNKIKNIPLIILVTIGITSCAFSDKTKFLYENKYKQVNTIPMYGAPHIKKTDDQKKLDKEFIQAAVKESGSRKKSAIEFSLRGWLKRKEGNNRVAIMRFNQSWLLDPNYYQPYWGFGVIYLAKNKPKKASELFEKALSLIDEEKEKPRLQVDAARAYAWQASEIKKTDSINSERLYKRANKLIDKALSGDPEYRKAYSMGGIISYDQGNYKRAWEIVIKSRDSGSYKFDSKFIEKLSKSMPEP
jgi:tetratricopeptide (TPR) repeat protein